MDAARGVALLAMASVHVLPVADPDGTTSVAHLVAGGRAAATFAVLAGVGLALATGGTRRPEGRSLRAATAGVAARAAAIGAVGLVLGGVESGVAVILAYYALLFVLAVPLLRLAPAALAAVAVVAAVAVPVGSHVLRDAMAPATGENPTFSRLVEDPGGVLAELALTGYYPALPWLVYLCAGLAVGRLALRSARVATALAVGGAGLAVAAVLASSVLLGPLGGEEAILAASPDLEAQDLDRVLSRSQHGTTPTDTWWWLAVDTPHSSTPLDLLHTTGTALALLGAALIVARVAAPLLAPLVAVGAMTLTLYSAHVLLLSTSLLPADPETSYLVQVVGAIACALLWRRARGERGPLEAAVGAVAGAASQAAAGAGAPASAQRA